MISTSEEAATPEIAEGFLPEDMRYTPTQMKKRPPPRQSTGAITD